MWRRFGLVCFLLGVPLSSAANLKLAVTKSAGSGSAATAGTVTTPTQSSGSSSLASANGGWHMKAVTTVQARVQGDAPVWNAEAKMWLSKYGTTTELAYMNNLDTVNTASVEGALMYVQAEGINVNEQSVKCHRKNDMQYVVFYEMTIVQPTYGIKYYEDHAPAEYGEFVAMDGAKCTDEGSDISDDCKVYYGLDGEPDIGPVVGSNLQTSDPRAPYPGNYWFSYPNSCAQKLRADKTDACRAEYPGGLCAMGTSPDGDNCTFGYKILGYLNIDDLVGITEMGYSNYTEFCEDGGVEFKATNTGSGFEVDESIDFWEKPGDEDANSERTKKMVELYNELASNGTSANMEPLPSVETLTSANPKCYENNAKCASSQYGCSRTLYSQLCTVCSSSGDGCEAAPSTFSFPDLKLPANATKPSSNDSSSSTSTEAGSTTDSAHALSDGSGKKGSSNAASTTTASVAVALVALIASSLL
ncbi:Protease inhibitor EpiC3 [Phytophthora cinnamomi]|uniref:Protease inhibitor EpiC3 n=1 Tax=Phytophthora cinnamomi TaxID=4785 RepID=UPI003559779B|nr:Protease inhibitor EpiC3 [Phytophthora cinnamomi]